MIGDKIYNLVGRIPKGKVASYGQISSYLDIKSPRLVGAILHKNPDPKKTPCHRVVFSNGSLSPSYTFGGEDQQRKKLKKEGVSFTKKGRVNLEKYLVNFNN